MVPETPLAMRFDALTVKPEVVLEYTLYVTEQFDGGGTAVQLRLICVDPLAFAVRLEGIDGSVVQAGGDVPQSL